MKKWLVNIVPIAEYQSRVTRRWQWQLKGRVEVVLLLRRTMNYLTLSHDDETAVADVGSVNATRLLVQNDNTSGAAACDIWTNNFYYFLMTMYFFMTYDKLVIYY